MFTFEEITFTFGEITFTFGEIRFTLGDSQRFRVFGISFLFLAHAGANSPEIPQREGVLGSEIAA